jgi:MOSC domain-containing protein YiiM
MGEILASKRICADAERARGLIPNNVRRYPLLQQEHSRVGTVCEIYIADAAKAPVRLLDHVAAIPDRGLEGDRYHRGAGSFSRWPGTGRALTLIAAEDLDAVRAEFDIDLSAGQHRRNLVTRGVDLRALNGKKFRIGGPHGPLLRGTREAAPCDHLARLVSDSRIMQALKGRGGLRAEILEAGIIRAGDDVTLA